MPKKGKSRKRGKGLVEQAMEASNRVVEQALEASKRTMKKFSKQLDQQTRRVGMKVKKPIGKVGRRAVHRETDAPYVRGSRTSRAAAESLSKEDLNRMELKVFDCIRRAKLKGRTDEEIEGETGLRHQSASARRRKLVLKGKVRDSGFVRRNRSRRLAIVWEVGIDETATEGKASGRVPRPSNQEMFEAAQGMRNNAQMGAEAGKVAAWLVYLARG